MLADRYARSLTKHGREAISASGSVMPDALLSGLDSVRRGFLLVDGAGRLVFRTAPAQPLLEKFGPGLGGATSVGPLLRALCASAAEPRRDLFRAVRQAIAQSAPATFEAGVGGDTIQIDLHPAVGTGWVVTLEDVSARRAAEASAAKRPARARPPGCPIPRPPPNPRGPPAGAP